LPEITIEPARDSYITPVQPNTNFGADTSVICGVLYAGASKVQWRRGIGLFDVNAIPGGATIDAAKLQREISAIAGTPTWLVRLARVTRTDWVENQVTWNNYKTGSTWTDGGGDFDDVTPAAIDFSEAGAAGLHELVGLKPFVDDAIVSRGGLLTVLLRLKAEAPGVTQEAAWWSREKGVQRWRLVVAYTPAASAPGVGPRRGRLQPGAGAPPAPRGARTGRRASQASAGSRPGRVR